MNEIAFTVLATAASLLAVGAPLHMLVTSIARPGWLVYMDAKRRPWLTGAYFIACAIGFGMFTYYGIRGIFGWSSMAHHLGIVAAAVGAFAIPQALMAGAHNRLK